jgi:acyl-CoA hydrolase
VVRAGRDIALASIDWAKLIRPGELVVWGQASAEPVTLVAALLESRASIGGFRAFVGMSNSPHVDIRYTDHVTYSSYCGTGGNSRLGEQLNILPINYGQLAQVLGPESPAVILSLAEGRDSAHFSYGAGGDYIGDLVHRARIVIAEVSDQSPRTGSGADLRRDQIDIVVHTNSVPPAPVAARLGATELAIAARVAALIPDGGTLQFGIGAIPAAVLRALTAHRDLGIHSGQLTDEVADLAVSVAGFLAGGPRLMRWADGNAKLALRPTRFTHDPTVLASIERFVAVNSAIEVDLSGQVNAEVAAGRYVGGVGGAGAFLRGALESRGGVPIIALPSTAGTRSRIVTRLSGPVSTARADVGYIVTEYGIADLHGLSLRSRRAKMLDIAHPEHRDALDTD